MLGLVAADELESARGRASRGGMRSASASAETATRPPAARTSRARARSPTRCGGGSRPDLQLTPRLGRSATRSSPRNQAAASGDVVRVCVLGLQARREGGRALRGSCRDDERQSGLGDARAGLRQLLEERAEALALGELTDERVEDGSVHDERRNRGSAAPNAIRAGDAEPGRVPSLAPTHPRGSQGAWNDVTGPCRVRVN